MRQPTKQIAKRRRKEAAAVPALDAQALAREVGARINAILEASGPTIRAILEEPEAKTWKASSVPEVLARLGTSRTADVVVVLEATLDQFAGVLEIIARYGEATGQAEAPLPPALAGQVEHVRALAGAAETTLRVLRGPSPQSPAIADVFRDGLASLPTYQSLWGVLQAIQEGRNALQQWTDNNGQTVPMRPVYDGKGTAYLSVREPAGDRRPAAAVIRSLWAKVRELDDLTSDVLLYCLCCWATRTSSPGEFVWIIADRVLDERGVQRKRYRSEGLRWLHGHRRDDRLAVWQALVRLKDLWLEMLDVEVLPARRGRKAQFVRVESPLLLTDARMTQHDLDNNEAFLAAQVAPGRWARELWEVLGPQTGLLARKALEYDPYRERPEKRLAKYLAFHVRRNAQWHAEELPLRVATLLDALGDAIPADPARPGRTKDRLDKALDRLVADHVIGRWVYVDAPELPARGWFDQWLTWRVVISPADNVIAHYSAMKLPKPRAGLPASVPASDRDAIVVEPGRYRG